MLKVLLICLMASTLLVILVFVATQRGARVGLVCKAMAALSLLGGFCLSPLFGLQIVLTCLFGLICWFVAPNRQAVRISAIAAMVLSYGVFVWMGVDELNEVAQLREDYPFESMADRLAYEAERTRPSGSSETATPASLELSEPVEEQLAKFEMGSENYLTRRAWDLHSLHRRNAYAFAVATGFGSVRMNRINREVVELPESPPIPLPAPPPVPHYDPDHVASPDENDPDMIPDESFFYWTSEKLKNMHRDDVREFLDPERMGYIEDREHVAGFEPHQLQEMPKLDGAANGQHRWKVTQLELISLLKHDQPVAYVSRHLPRMDELRDAPTRPLNAFESQALKQLREERDVVMQDGVNEIRMLGSIRAAKTCLQCHSVQRGELLGAFSYRLHRFPPQPQPKPNKPVDPHAWHGNPSFRTAAVSTIQQP